MLDRTAEKLWRMGALAQEWWAIWGMGSSSSLTLLPNT